MDFNWDQIEAYNRAPEDEHEHQELSSATAKKVVLHTNKRLATITSLAAKGHSKTNIAKTLGISLQRVSQVAKKNNVRFSVDNAKNLNWKKMSYRVGVYAHQGCTPNEVAAILQISAQEVTDFATENRIVFREQPNAIRELLG